MQDALLVEFLETAQAKTEVAPPPQGLQAMQKLIVLAMGAVALAVITTLLSNMLGA